MSTSTPETQSVSSLPSHLSYFNGSHTRNSLKNQTCVSLANTEITTPPPENCRLADSHQESSLSSESESDSESEPAMILIAVEGVTSTSFYGATHRFMI